MKKLLLSLIAVFLCLPFANAKEYEITIKGGQAEMPVHLLKFESWNVKAHA